ncbi:MAG: hypothetical protein NTZ98_24040, partial [Acidobacteria bacterium]|nr:hypothetical protein [Acidobacteriota bacterium]
VSIADFGLPAGAGLKFAIRNLTCSSLYTGSIKKRAVLCESVDRLELGDSAPPAGAATCSGGL